MLFALCPELGELSDWLAEAEHCGLQRICGGMENKMIGN